MDFKELLKKYWFIGVVFVLLVVFVGIYAVNYVQSLPVSVNTKKVDGQYVVYSIDDENVTADDLYDKLYESYGLSSEMVSYEKLMFNQMETTDEMSDTASSQASAYVAYYGESSILSTLKAAGYTGGIDDLTQYLIDSQKQRQIINEYALANEDTYITPMIGEDGRLIYHILINVADIEEVTDADGNVVEYKANPTEEETAALQTVLDALDEGTSFQQVAYSYSDDSGSSSNGGYIGIVNSENASGYYATFAQAALQLEDGEVSEPVLSKAGYHIIYNAGMTAEELMNDDYFVQSLESTYSNLVSKAIINKGKELNITVNSDALNEYIESVESEEE